MHINLSSEMEQYLQAKVESGDYGNASEVVRDAIRRMREDEKKIDALQEAVKISTEQIARGEYEAYTPELLNRITERAFANAQAGRKIKRDVLPDDED